VSERYDARERLAVSEANYLMIESTSIKNYKCFKELDLRKLAPINIVVGDNGSGKTTFLEGLFLLSGGSPELSVRTRTWRGLASVASVAAVSDLFLDLFHDFKVESPVVLSFSDSDRGERRLTITFEREQTFSLPLTDDQGGEPSSRRSTVVMPMRFQWTSGDKVLHVSEIKIEGNELRFTGTTDTYPGVFLTVAGTNAAETATRFSRLSKRRESDRLVASVNRIFPMVQGLTVETDGPNPVLYADVKGVSQRIPLAMVSFGISRFVAILAAINDAPKNAVFVDEIDTGIYYDHLPAVLTCLAEECLRKDLGVQLFVSTHSMECLQGFQAAVEKNAEAFSVLRMLRRPSGECVVRQFSGSDYGAALKQHVEFR
jgi:hypothetical protein